MSGWSRSRPCSRWLAAVNVACTGWTLGSIVWSGASICRGSPITSAGMILRPLPHSMKRRHDRGPRNSRATHTSTPPRMPSSTQMTQFGRPPISTGGRNGRRRTAPRSRCITTIAQASAPGAAAATQPEHHRAPNGMIAAAPSARRTPSGDRRRQSRRQSRHHPWPRPTSTAVHRAMHGRTIAASAARRPSRTRGPARCICRVSVGRSRNRKNRVSVNANSVTVVPLGADGAADVDAWPRVSRAPDPARRRVGEVLLPPVSSSLWRSAMLQQLGSGMRAPHAAQPDRAAHRLARQLQADQAERTMRSAPPPA